MAKLREMDIRTIHIKLIDGSKINGQVNINREPGHDRLSDLIATNKEPFLVVFNATTHEDELENLLRHRTLFVNKKHIIWATPDEDQK
ncbi:MAG: hypothetical protein K8S13_00230 [Desulfobacula sp.]|uniref:DUF6812 domain-containing protein n=1 Tax=Desulfobacula sp. TaxID=2593537 RepID=UPI0025B86BBE|nr:hypothetical protein [Desulfobacula sp.]MCD4718275.1 hypothetical protein [Desulfobacula sp.]